jgi:hypothetical protein
MRVARRGTAGRIIQRATHFWASRWNRNYRESNSACMFIGESAFRHVTGRVSGRGASYIELLSDKDLGESLLGEEIGEW